MPSKKLKIDVSGAADNDGREQTPSKVIILRMTPDKLKMLLGTSTTPNTRVNAKTVINRYNSPLLKLPPEVTDKIYQYAVYVDGAIKPVQFLQRSNKFVWAESQVVGFRQAKEVEAAEPLTVVQLTQSCHKMYVDVAATHMFYAINHFDFVKPWSYYYNNNENAVNYLLAITPNRLSSIRTITLSLQYAWYNGFMTKGLAIDTFTALGTCSGLENLHLIIRSSYHGPADISLTKAAGFKQLRAAVRGLKSLKVTFQKDHGIDNVKEYEIVEPLLVEEMSKPRDACFSVGDFRRAQLNVKLDIHGEGRLAKDKKPNFVASRTRQGIRKEAASDGTLSNGPIAKYDAGGSLNWVIDDVKASRSSSIDGIDSVEFLVSCDSERTVFNWFEDRSLRKGNHIQEFWEDLSKLNSKESRNSCRLLAFYRKTPEAFGKDLVLKDWETKDNDGGDEEEGYKVTLGKLRSLRALVRADLKAADRAVKSEALKAAKAKATKAKAAADKKQAKGKKSYN